MKAIIITEELKSLNPIYFSGILNLGTIKTLNELPKSFKSLTWQNGRLTEGYHKLDNSVHEADGFYNLVTPTYNKETQTLGDLYFNVYSGEQPILDENGVEIGTETITTKEFTYAVIDKTQTELDAETVKVAKDDFKNNLEGVFAYATTPDGLNEYAIKIGNDGKIVTVLIP